MNLLLLTMFAFGISGESLHHFYDTGVAAFHDFEKEVCSYIPRINMSGGLEEYHPQEILITLKHCAKVTNFKGFLIEQPTT